MKAIKILILVVLLLIPALKAESLDLIHPQTDPECRYDNVIEKEGEISFSVNGERFIIESQFSMPNGKWTKAAPNTYFKHSRKVVKKNGYLHITDTFKNLTGSPLPVKQRHTCNLTGQMKKAWCAGYTTGSGNIQKLLSDNPTSYAIKDKSGIGFMALSDEMQIHVMNYSLKGILGLADDQCVIPENATYSAEWVIVPTERPDFWDFVNACRRIRNVNYTLTGMFALLSFNTTMKDEGDLKAFIRNKSANIVASGLPLYNRLVAHGTVCQKLGQTIYDQYAAHFDRVRGLVPGTKTQVYFHSYIDASSTAAEVYKDARVMLIDGTQGNYTNVNYRVFFPTLTNQYGKDIAKNVDLIFDECKADGVYWDEMNSPKYKYHFGEPGMPLEWDGISGDINSRGELLRLKSSVILLSQKWMMGQVKRIMMRGPLIANTAPVTRTLADLHFQSFVETADVSNLNRAILYSPIALGDHRTEHNVIDAYRGMVNALNYGCLYSWYSETVRPEYETLTKYMFPITPIELHEGYIIGQERIVTNRSGLFGWGDNSVHEVHVFNDEGREVMNFNAPRKTIEGKIYTELRLAKGWTAEIIRRFVRDWPRTVPASSRLMWREQSS